MASLKKASFVGGEVSPRLWGRADQPKYQSGLETCRNWLITREGVATNRPGTKFIMPHPLFADGEVRQIPFVFSSDQSYVLVFTDQRLHFIRNGSPILEASKVVNGITAANPSVVTVTSHGYADDDLVFMAQANPVGHPAENRFFRVDSTAANTFELMEQTDVNGSSWVAYSGGITCSRVHAISTPYLAADLPNLRFSQSGDVLTITHPSYAPRNLSRLSDTSWTLSVISFQPTLDAPAGGAGSGSAGSETVKYQVTAVDEDTLEESFAGYGNTQTFASLERGGSAPVSVTTASSHGYASGERVTFSGIVDSGFTFLNGNIYIITVTAVDSFTLAGTTITGPLVSVPAPAGEVEHNLISVPSVIFPSATDAVDLTWDTVAGAGQYNVYREVNGIYGYIGSSVSGSFEDLGYSSDASDTPPIQIDVFAASGDWPTAVGRFQQRLVLGGSANDPESNRASRIGLFYNFTKSNPIQDDDSIRWIIADEKLQRVKHYVQLNTLFVCTQEGLWSIEGDDAGTLTPSAINPRKRSEEGISDVRPLVVGKSILYVQYQSSIISELSPGDSYGSYNTSDLTVFSQHLFEGHSVTDWSHARIPYSVVWSIRDDGTMLGLTYLKEQQVQSWHRHDTGDGDEFTSVCCIPEGNESATYVAVRRYGVNGQTRRYIERMATRQVLSRVDGRFTDSFCEYEDANASIASTYQLNYDDSLSGSDAWWIAPTGTTPPFATGLSSADIGKVILIYGNDGERLWCTIESVNSADNAFVSVSTDSSGVMESDGSPSVSFSSQLPLETDNWSSSVSSIGCLWHLEGRQVYVLGDGYPQGPFTVSGGSVTLSEPAVIVSAGLPIEADLRTLDPDYADQETLLDKPKTVSKITLMVERTAGLLVGLDEDHLNNETHYKFQGETDGGGLRTGRLVVQCAGRTDASGRIFIRQSEPLPATILAAVPTVSFGRA